ncbi:EpsG family protein [Klebsiella pneumoniae]|uniref:Capsular repeat unit polymerase n=2 Tax=Klebsiella pneumoniae TaxID=573 RepID=A0A193SF01_KLEPN|nr:capsular repeat unit polymerase [Klebsiella pneumoniae]EIX9600583.1 EpsG family protein [Klebsiella pneumoniae]MBP3995230.1 EpsG family protein [Klebsiella pneumoniae]PJG78372.1 EpsG family protein [Klebsiella pneumoniae]CZQ25122.1 capsular repeat unit polymerase [Klebsiella pneumoniae]
MPYFLLNSTLFLYFLISIFLLVLSIISIVIKSKKMDGIVFFFIAIMMVAFYGLRFPGTVDVKMYLQNFDALSSFQNFEWGIGFYILMKSIKEIDVSHEAFVFYSALYFVIAFVLVGFFYCKGKYYKSLFLISSFYSWSILDLAVNTYRQGIAVPFILLGLYFLSQRKYFVSLLAIVISLTLHWGSAVILMLYMLSIFLSKKPKLLRLISIFTVSLFTISFFINFSIAEILSSSSFLSVLKFIFVGVDFDSKVNAYLGGGVLGANFYDMNSLQRLYFSGEVYIALIVFVVFFITRKKQELIVNDGDDGRFLLIYSFFICVSLYGVVLISMTWFIRNFYWVVPVAPVLYVIILEYYESTFPKRFKIFLLMYAVFIVAYSVETFWRTPLIDMSYPSITSIG